MNAKLTRERHCWRISHIDRNGSGNRSSTRQSWVMPDKGRRSRFSTGPLSRTEDSSGDPPASESRGLPPPAAGLNSVSSGVKRKVRSCGISNARKCALTSESGATKSVTTCKRTIRPRHGRMRVSSSALQKSLIRNRQTPSAWPHDLCRYTSSFSGGSNGDAVTRDHSSARRSAAARHRRLTWDSAISRGGVADGKAAGWGNCRTPAWNMSCRMSSGMRASMHPSESCAAPLQRDASSSARMIFNLGDRSARVHFDEIGPDLPTPANYLTCTGRISTGKTTWWDRDDRWDGMGSSSIIDSAEDKNPIWVA
ncbi:unnamed protein product [Mycena citricolor]|uniref:Uncharacterized protein n=1 Tax=Mycena citricolor TaxID=2018698 RepID=A0AAD2H5I7_9AGAR|nr:unnamed protein product [Mycena citricolor]